MQYDGADATPMLSLRATLQQAPIQYGGADATMLARCVQYVEGMFEAGEIVLLSLLVKSINEWAVCQERALILSSSRLYRVKFCRTRKSILSVTPTLLTSVLAVELEDAATVRSKNAFYPSQPTLKVYSDAIDGRRSLVQWAYAAYDAAGLKSRSNAKRHRSRRAYTAVSPTGETAFGTWRLACTLAAVLRYMRQKSGSTAHSQIDEAGTWPPPSSPRCAARWAWEGQRGSSTKVGTVHAEDDCVICLDPLQDPQRPCAMLKCRGKSACTHVFHQDCATTIKPRLCPLCRTPFDELLEGNLVSVRTPQWLVDGLLKHIARSSPPAASATASSVTVGPDECSECASPSEPDCTDDSYSLFR
jgi:hypothetical protein